MIIGRIREMWRYPVKSMAGQRLDSCELTPTGIVGDRGWALRDESTKEIRGAKKWPVLMQCSALYREEPARGRIPHARITFPDGSQVESDDANVHARLSELVGQAVSLWPLQPAANKAHYRRTQPGASLVGFMGRSRTLRRVLQRIVRYTPIDADLRAELSREPGEPLPDLTDFPAELFAYATSPGTYFDSHPIHVLTTASLEAMGRFNPSAAWDVRRFRPNFLIETDPSLSGLIERTWRGQTLHIGEIQLKCDTSTVRCGMTMHPQAELPKDPSVLRSIMRDADQNLGIYVNVLTSGRVRVGDAVEIGV